MNGWFDWFGAGTQMGLKLELKVGLALSLLWMALCGVAGAQAVTTTTVQGTVYLANGQVGSGTLVLSWPAFTTASGQSVAADSTTVTIAADGFVSANLAPNLGATPAGLYYTAVYYLSDGTVTTQYWVVPAAAQATIAQVQAQLMPAAQAVQAVSKSYVDQAISEATLSQLGASGGTLTGPLYLNGDPTQPLQAADKHYVDDTFAEAVPLAGGNMTGALQTPSVNGVQSPLAGSAQTTLQTAITAAGTSGAMEIPPAYAGTDTFTNPNGVYIKDLRPTGAQQQERSVKEFGAVCDGVMDDTNALQAALNYANAHNVALTIPQGTCKTHSLNWRGESIGGLGKQVSALMGFPGQDVLATVADSVNLLSYTRLHDLTIYVDQSIDISCSAAEGRAPAGTCAVARLMEKNSIFSPGGNGLIGTTGTGAAWAVGNCAIAMPAATGAGGNGLKVAEIENVEIAATGVDPMAAEYPGAHSTHTCGLYLAQWPQWSEFRNIDIRGLNTGVAIPALPVTTPAGLNADSNRWQNITIQATHAFTAAAGSNNVLDNVVAKPGNSSATAEPPTGLVLDFAGSQQGWTVRNAVVFPAWNAVQPQLTVTAAGGAVTAVAVGSEHGLGFDPYGTQVPLSFSGSCTAQATASVNSNGSIGTVTATSGGVGCSGTTTASVSVADTWDTDAPVNLVSGQNMTFFSGNLLKGSGGYTVWNASASQSNGTELGGGGGNLPGGGAYAALVVNGSLGSAVQVDQFAGANFGAKLQACLAGVSATYGGTCDARNFMGSLSIASNLTISTANTSVLLPCATIATASQIIVTAGTRNVSLRGCALRGGSAASGSQGGTVLLYSGTGAMVQVGDPTYAVDTSGFHMDNLVINTTAASSATAQGLVAYRTQELNLENLYFLGNANQTGMTLDGTGNYTGGSFFGNQFSGFQSAVNAIGHQVANAATTDWMNASTFVRLHIDCPTSGGNPISGTYGINLQQGDGNTFTGGDVEGCSTALHLGANAQNNTIVGLRNENSTNQVVADSGSSYNNWMTGGTMFTGQLTDNGTRNSFLDAFHRNFNGLNGDWYGSQQDATVTDHQRLGIGLGNERGRLTEYQTDYGYRWEDGLTDGSSGEQLYNIQDLINNVSRFSVGQYLSATANTVTNVMVNNGGCYSSSAPPTISFSGGGGSGAAATAVMAASSTISCSTYKISTITVTAPGSGYTSQPAVSFSAPNQTSTPSVVAEITTAGSTNNQTVLNAAGTGAVVLNGSNNAGTGGVVIGSGGATETTVATVSNAGNAQFSGTLTVGGTAQSAGTMTVRNNSDAEVDYYLWPGLTTSQKGAFTYKDWNGTSQWYMVKDASNNWSLNSAPGGLDSFKAYQSTNSGDTYVDASNSSGTVRVNYETGSGTGFNIYGGGSSSLYASFTGTTSIKFPGLAAGSGHDCLQIDTSGYLTNTGSACGTGSGGGSGGSGTVGSGTTGQIAYYSAAGTTVGGISQVPVSAGGTGASTAAGALTSLGAQAVVPGLASDGANGIQVTNNGTFGGNVTAATVTARDLASIGPRYDVTQYGAVGNGYSTTGSMSAGSNDLSVVSGSAWVIGQGIQVVGAGTGGTAPLLTTVTAISSNTLTLAASAVTAVSSGIVLSDDTAGIQAAFNACWNNATNPYGGVVEFPGGSHNYSISHTIYAYDSCRIEGVNASGTRPSMITWTGTNSTGTTIPFTTFAIGANSSYSGPSSPSAMQPYFITISASNSLSAGNWVLINGCTTAGIGINNTVAEVAAASSASFTLVVPYTPPVLGTGLTDSCTATTTTVGIAFDAISHFQNEVKDIELWESSTYPASEMMGADLYYGSRIDSGSRVYNSAADSGLYFDYYFANGGINVDFDKGWRSDSAAKIANVYWRVGGDDRFNMATGSLSANNGASGAYLMIDNQGCNSSSTNAGHFGFHNMTFEVDSPFNPGFGAVTMLACPTYPDIQFFLSFENTGVYCAAAADTNCPALAMINKDDAALAIEYVNSVFAKPFLNLPAATRADLTGSVGYHSLSAYSRSGASFNVSSQTPYTSVSQAMTDFNFEQLWQDGVQASALLYSDTGFAAMPNGTTLTVGQILAPPAYWSAASPSKRYALDVVTQAGTTGTPNYGVTTCVASASSTLACSGPSATISGTSCSANVLTVNTSTNTFAAGEQVILIGTEESSLNGVNGGVLTVASANASSFTASYTCGGFTGNGSDTGTAIVSSTVDLSPNQFFSIGGIKGYIVGIDTANPASILVSTSVSVSAITLPEPLTYSPPELGPEMQLLTKSSAVPTSGTWSEGDYVENSSAAANGVAGWVNVVAGTPGAWAAVPLGTSAGLVAPAQLSASSTQVNGQTCALGGSCTVTAAATPRVAYGGCSGTALSSSTVGIWGLSEATSNSCSNSVTGTARQGLLMPASGTLSNLTVRCGTTGVNSSSGLFNIYDTPSGTSFAGAGTATGLTVTYGTTAADTAVYDNTHTYAYAKGDYIVVKLTSQASETLANCSVSFNY